MTPHALSPQLIGFILEDQTELTLEDICRACASPAEPIIELVDEGVLAPQGAAPEHWRFTGLHMQRARVALRLQHDLGVNPAGAALALELLDEVDTLRTQLRLAAGSVLR